ncbi:hypothetical protein ACWDYH_38310 [Nocardia goodfellowii]
MFKKKNNTKRPAPAAPGPKTAPAAPDSGPGAVDAPVLRNDNERALWTALGSRPGAATAALADAAGMSLSTARRALLGWETAGAVRSEIDPTSSRSAKIWTATAPAVLESAAPEPATAEPAAQESVPYELADPVPADSAATSDDPAALEPVSPEPADTDPAGDGAAPELERLPAGALRGQVEDYLRDHPNEEFSPHQIGKTLGRSSGAVHNALVALTKGGTARQTSEAPKRFTLASA